MHEYTTYFLDCHSVRSMYFSYSCILSLSIKNPMSSQESSFTQSRSLNGILLIDNTKINKASFDTKQSVVSIYIVTICTNQGMTSTMSKVKENLISLFSTLVIVWCYNLILLADLVFWQRGYYFCNLVLLWHIQRSFDMWVMAP